MSFCSLLTRFPFTVWNSPYLQNEKLLGQATTLILYVLHQTILHWTHNAMTEEECCCQKAGTIYKLILPKWKASFAYKNRHQSLLLLCSFRETRSFHSRNEATRFSHRQHSALILADFPSLAFATMFLFDDIIADLISPHRPAFIAFFSGEIQRN